jgi:8-oxo-dGTP diphosphatase
LTTQELNKRMAVPLTADCVVFGPYEESLQILLIERKKPPFKGKWALPGGFLEGEETLEETALRELHEETGLGEVFLKQFFTFSRADRDPRGRIISTAFYALLTPYSHQIEAGEDAEKVRWWKMNELPFLAFDHLHIIQMGLENLKRDLKISPLIFEVLPRHFSLGQLQKIYECILNRPVDKRNFWKKLQLMPFIIKTTEVQKGSRRPASLYRFDRQMYQTSVNQGFIFDL